MAIVDQFGRPFNKEVLDGPQTTRTAQIQRHWPEHPSRGLDIRRLPRILEAAERGDIAARLTCSKT
ncbi:Mu-like prophage FluMu protein gp29 [Dickeya aquatica]|uniref:Mu-like prophage FluMu protein gp29 n=1 Tax=Dickeya aquatica TaxID=1401087 RepID=A0A375ADE1_9GAMM|nr:Mu-like prophage FluMu protein gp29 [Dickeya aquatica]